MELGVTTYNDFVTSSPTSGNAVDADHTPTVEVFEDDNDVPILVYEAVKRTSKTGNYRVKVERTTANGYEAGKSYNVVVTAIVEGVTSKFVVASFLIEDKMSKLLDTATRVTLPIPDTFVPSMDIDPPLIVQAPEVLFSDWPLFQQSWDYENRALKDPSTVPHDDAIAIQNAETAYQAYLQEKSDYDLTYSLQREIQWKEYVAQKMIDNMP